VLGLMVAGTFGVVWTAPWKDDVERLTDSASDTIQRARLTFGVLDEATGGDCSRVGKAAPDAVREAVEAISDQLAANPDAEVDGASGMTVRDVARRQAQLIAKCIAAAPRTGPGWTDLKRRLERGSGT
jgi:hypothetical protein